MVTFWTTFGCHFGADGPGVIFTAGLGVIFTAGLGVIFTAGLGVISTAGLGVIFTAGLGVIFTAGRVVTFTAGLGIVQVVWFHARVHVGSVCGEYFSQGGLPISCTPPGGRPEC